MDLALITFGAIAGALLTFLMWCLYQMRKDWW